MPECLLFFAQRPKLIAGKPKPHSTGECTMRWFCGSLLGLALLVGSTLVYAQVNEQTKDKIDKALPDKAFAKPKQQRHLLIYSKTLGFRHGSIPAGTAAIKMLGEKTGAWTAEHSEDPAMFDENRLAKFDAVLFLNTTGDCLAPTKEKLSPEEEATLEKRKQNLLAFVKSGKGFAGFHSATDTFYSWKEYGDMIGGWFKNHPWHEKVPIKIDDAKSPLTSMFEPAGFEITDEIYQFAPKSASGKFQGYQPYSRTKVRVLLSLNAATFPNTKKGERPDMDYAISWIHEFGKGRVFYCALGHRDDIYWNPVVLKHYLAGLQYALGDLAADATPSAAPAKG
jgi:type 1 glutamine amidotransferase